jgi:SAM-dependent methyltransferase
MSERANPNDCPGYGATLWETIWTAGGRLKVGEGFDAGEPLPALGALIHERTHGQDAASRAPSRALVPGCGRGYDVTALTALFHTVVGLDISASAVAAAREQHAAAAAAAAAAVATAAGNDRLRLQGAAAADAAAPAAPAAPDGRGAGAVFETGDFFGSFESGEAGSFDLLFDYTFLCTLRPERRHLWAKRARQLLRPGGELVAAVFPIFPDGGSAGPPYHQSLEGVSALLQPLGFQERELRLLGEGESHGGRDGSGPGGARSGWGRWVLAVSDEL